MFVRTAILHLLYFQLRQLIIEQALQAGRIITLVFRAPIVAVRYVGQSQQSRPVGAVCRPGPETPAPARVRHRVY